MTESVARAASPRRTVRVAVALVTGQAALCAVIGWMTFGSPDPAPPRATRPVAPLVQVAHPGVLVEAVKLADDESGDVVVRLYESGGGRATGVLRTGFPLAGAQVTDLLERPLEDAAVEDGGVRVSLRPFQVLTLRLSRGGVG